MGQAGSICIVGTTSLDSLPLSCQRPPLRYIILQHNETQPHTAHVQAIEHLYSPQVVSKINKNTNNNLNKQAQCTRDKQRITRSDVT